MAPEPRLAAKPEFLRTQVVQARRLGKLFTDVFLPFPSCSKFAFLPACISTLHPSIEASPHTPNLLISREAGLIGIYIYIYFRFLFWRGQLDASDVYLGDLQQGGVVVTQTFTEILIFTK